MKKKITISIFIFLLAFCFNAYAGVTAGDFKSEEQLKSKVGSMCSQTMQDAKESWDSLANSVNQDYIELAEQSKNQAQDCLNGILNADFGFSLGVPSPSNFLNAACTQVRSYAHERLQRLEQNYNFSAMNDFFSFGAEGGLTGGDKNNQIDVEGQGREIADTVWDEINRNSELY